MSADLRMQVGGLLARTAATVHLKRRCAAGPLCSAQLSSPSSPGRSSEACSRCSIGSHNLKNIQMHQSGGAAHTTWFGAWSWLLCAGLCFWCTDSEYGTGILAGATFALIVTSGLSVAAWLCSKSV